MANKERLQKVLDHLRNLDPKKFNYNKWVGEVDGSNCGNLNAISRLINNECGTTGCVAGWACAILVDKTNRSPVESICNVAQDLLELTDREMRFLFYADPLLKHDEVEYPGWWNTGKYDDSTMDDLPIQEAIDRLEFAIQNF